MNDMAIKARREYYRAWRAKNRDKVSEYNARYWAKRAEREAKSAEHEQKKDDETNR